MSRGLTAGQITHLESREPIYDLAIKIDKPGRSYTKYFTTGQFDLSYQSQNYIKDNGISNVSNVFGEDAKITGTPFSITFQTTDSTFFSEFSTDDYKNLTTVQVTLIFRDKTSGNAPDTTDAIPLFTGLLDSTTLKSSDKTQSFTMNFTNPIAFGFDNQLGRKANNLTRFSSTASQKSFWRSQ